MKPAPTLIDQLYRLSFSPKQMPGWRSNVDMRHALESARRFVVDAPMSAFMAELANESFLRFKNPDGKLPRKIADSLRVSARLPHDAVWIEYLLRPYQQRSSELRGKFKLLHQFNDVPEREGWLIQQHPKIDTACIMHLFVQDDVVREDGHSTWTFPFAFGWCCDDNPLPWHCTVKKWEDKSEPYAWPSSYLSGLPRYNRENVTCVRSPLVVDLNSKHHEAYTSLLQEWTGVLRRVWSLLATIDHLPIMRGDVRQSKGFLARGRIRKYLSHQTITLNVPARRDTRVLARDVIAIAHRKRHEVRGHWRDDWRNPPSRRCNPHIWDNADDSADIIRCQTCGGRQFYIHKHERGDASLGYVTHDYKVQHEQQGAKK